MNSKIYYIDCYQGENKEGNIGFVKLEDEKIFVMLRGIYAGSGMDCKVYAWDRKGQQTQVMTVSVRNGYGQASCRWPGDMNMIGMVFPSAYFNSRFIGRFLGFRIFERNYKAIHLPCQYVL